MRAAGLFENVEARIARERSSVSGRIEDMLAGGQGQIWFLEASVTTLADKVHRVR